MEAPLDCIIIEDEPGPRKLLKEHLTKIPQVRVQKSFSNAIEALDYLKKKTPHIILLDIHLPGISGIDFLQNVVTENIDIIITTAHSQYALESYNFDVVHYLTKPVKYSELVQAIGRVLKKTKGADKNIITLKEGKKKYQVELDHIDWIKSDGCYLTIWSRRVEKGNILVRMTQKELLKLLPSEKFSKINKSVITAYSFVEHSQTDRIILKNGENFSLARKYRSNFS